MSLASIKRKLKVGTLLKLIRHDFLKPITVEGNLGRTVIQPKIFIGQVRPIALIQAKQIALRTADHLSYLNWPKANCIRETANGFEIDLYGTGKFEHIMAYEILTMTEREAVLAGPAPKCRVLVSSCACALRFS